MSTATVESSPVTETALPDMASTFTATLEAEKAKETAAPVEAKQPVEQKKEEVKPAEVKKEEVKPKQEAAPAKKKSALDAALSDEAPSTEQQAQPTDEVEKLIASENPNWDAARATMKRQSAELKALQEQAKKAAEPSPELTGRLKSLEQEKEQLTKQLAEYKDAVVSLDVKYDPTFQAKYVQGRNNKVTALAARVKANGGDEESFIAAMELPVSKRSKALDAALENVESARDIATINAKLAEIETLDEERDAQLSNPHKTHEQIRQQEELRAAEHKAKVEQLKNATFEKVRAGLPKVSKFLRMAPADSEGATEYNAQLQADLEKAPTLLDVSPEEAVTLSFKAARYDSLEKIASERFAKDATRISELEASLAKYEGSEPGHRGGQPAKAASPLDVPMEKLFADALAAAKGGGGI